MYIYSVLLYKLYYITITCLYVHKHYVNTTKYSIFFIKIKLNYMSCWNLVGDIFYIVEYVLINRSRQVHKKLFYKNDLNFTN